MDRPSADCSGAALASFTDGVRQIRTRTAAAWPRPGGRPPQRSCAAAVAGAWNGHVQDVLLERASHCMGRDQPEDAAWDQLNSTVMSLGACLDCARAPEERARRCQQVTDALAHAQHAARN
jgi:hypothetical protein